MNDGKAADRHTVRASASEGIVTPSDAVLAARQVANGVILELERTTQDATRVSARVETLERYDALAGR
jgi:hypothetical protein